MKVYLIIIAVLILLGAAALFAYTPQRELKNVPPAATIIYYYPKVNVYYDTLKKDYLYLDKNTGTWQENEQLPEDLNEDLDTQVVLQNPEQPVWRNNEQHRLIYAVSLYATPSDLKEEPAEKSASNKKAASDDTDASEKKESGIKKFFRKIFKPES
ncbi:MAG: hypothetical protein ICV79_24730 [Flavisolibacter sp.]|nr:hypothetical protein [Flavisolibacter sp.]